MGRPIRTAPSLFSHDRKKRTGGNLNQGSIKIEYRKVDELIPYARNSRTHDAAQVAQIAGSIKEFGFTNPILADKDGVVAGHGRIMGAQLIYKDGGTITLPSGEELPAGTVPVLSCDGWSEPKRRAYVIADNKLSLNAGWDDELLKLELDDLAELGFDLELTGFSQDEIAAMTPEQVSAGLTDENAVPELPVDPTTKPGDLWLLGPHRLLCGSSTMVDDVTRLMDGQAPNTMITDPPYGVKYEADWRAKAKNVKATAREANSSLKNDDQADWYDAYVLFPGSVAYVWHASAFTDVVMDGLRRAGFEVKQQIIWNKNVHALSRSDFHWKHEPCWYAVKPKGDRNWKGGRTQMTVRDIKSVIFEDGKTAHPTQKPLEIYTRSLEFHTNQGEYVYDPFGGSGTLAIACEKLGRRALVMELDPKYCDVIVKRWQDFTGLKATLEADGRTFEECSL